MQEPQSLNSPTFHIRLPVPEARSPHVPSRRSRVLLRIGCLAALLAATGGCLWYRGGADCLARFRASGRQGHPEVRLHTVEHGTLRIGLVEEGQVRAMHSHAISSDLVAPSKITYIIPEGALVRKGVDVLLRFETKSLVDNLAAKRVELEMAKRQLTVAQESVKIEQAAGEAAVSTAASSLKTARAALDRFMRLDAPRAMRELDARITAARKALAETEKALRDSRRSLDDGMSVDEEQRKALEIQVETAREQLASAKKNVESLLTERKMLRAYDYPRDKEARAQDVQRAELELARARVAAESNLMAKEAEIGGAAATIDRIGSEIEDLQMELAKCEKKAPVDGIVLYGDAAMDFMAARADEIRIGSEVYPEQVILTIPDLSAFEVDILVGEEIRGRIEVGCQGMVTLEAIPGLRIRAELVRIDCLAQAVNPYDATSPKGFKGVVRLLESDKRIISGMTARAELVVQTLDLALMVPLEAVCSEQGETSCYLRVDQDRYRKQPVGIGQSNEDYVQILSGLRAGDQVALSRPPSTAVEAQEARTAVPGKTRPARSILESAEARSGESQFEDRT